MKILIVSEMSVPHATGGGETRYGLLSRQLAANGHDVTWLSMRQRKSGREERIDCVRHLHRGPRILNPPTRSLWAKLHFMAALCLHLLRHRYEVVDCQTYAPLLAAWLTCRLTGQPLVATIHDTSVQGRADRGADQWLSTWDRRLAPWVEGLLYQLPYDRVLSVSTAVRDDLVDRLGVRASRVSVVANAIDIDAIAVITPQAQAVDLVFVGRMVPHKHPESFLQLASLIDTRRRAAGHAPLQLRMVGGGPLLAQLPALAVRLGLSGQLDLCGELGSHTEVLAHIKAARVLVLPSTREGFGLVLAEAMAGGTAVAAYGLPPVAETLGSALHDCLAPPGDVNALVAVVQGLLDDEPRRQACIERGRHRVDAAFGMAAFVDAVLAAYGKALQSGQKSR